MPVRIYIFLLALLSTTAWAAPQIVEVEWSNTTYGPDGPWYAASVYVGFNNETKTGQRVDLYPGGSGTTEVFLPGYCTNSGVPAGQCAAQQGGFYNPNISTTVVPFSNQSFLATMNIDSTVQETLNGGHIYFDTIYFTSKQSLNSVAGLPDVHVNNSFIITLSSAQDSYPTGLVTTPAVGLLDIGGLDDDGFTNSTVITSGLFESGQTASASFGLHIGSVSMGIPPAMHYGGYDAARIVGDVLTSAGPTVSRNAETFAIQLNDIGIGTVEGASPFPQANRSGILAQGNSTLSSGTILPLLPHTPWMGLPLSACEALTQDLPVLYDGAIGIYRWNTSDPRYEQIVTSPSYVSFTFQSIPGTQQLSINVPFSLLNLTLEPPTLVSEPTQYFPCAPSDSDWYLGKAFLQAAFVGYNWKPKNPPGSFWLAQAPGPNLPPQQLTTIHGDDLVLPNNSVNWASTWAGHWTPLSDSQVASGGTQSNNGNSSSSSSGSGGLSSGAKAGLGVGLGLGIPLLAALVGAIFYLRRRNQKQETALEDSTAAGSSGDGRDNSPSELKKAELAAWEQTKHDEKHQLDGEGYRRELDGQDSRLELDDAIGGAANPAEAHSNMVHELPEDREYYNGMPVRVAGDPTQRVEIE